MANFPVSGKPMPAFDFKGSTIGEITDMNDPKQPAKEGQKQVAKLTGMSLEEVRDLNPKDFKALVIAMWTAYGEYMAEDEKN
jgi:hypothetical protein